MLSAMKCNEQGFEAVAMRGLWKRVTRDEQGIVELDLCTGPGGDDVGVALRVGDVLTPEVLKVLDEILGGEVAVIPIPSAADLLAEGWTELPKAGWSVPGDETSGRDERRRFECPRGVFVVRLPPRTAEETREVRAIVTSARNVQTDE